MNSLHEMWGPISPGQWGKGAAGGWLTSPAPNRGVVDWGQGQPGGGRANRGPDQVG